MLVFAQLLGIEPGSVPTTN